jgi:signal transduction histidine kinase
MSRVFGSVRVRITLVATVVFAIAFAGASWLLVQRVRDSLKDQVRDEGLAAVGDYKRRAEAAQQIADLRGLPESGVTFLQVLDAEGNVIEAAPGFAGVAPLTEDLGAGVGIRGSATAGIPGASAFTVEVPAGALPVGGGDQLVFVEQARTAEGPITIIAASPLDTVRRSVESLVDVLWLGIPLLIGLVGLLVWFLVGRALRPVAAIRAEVDEISHGTLHRRVPVPPSNDEVAHLAGTMNEMLDRLERSSAKQRAFVSDASHELRSPIATIQATLEVALEHDDQTDWRSVAHDVLAEDERMARVVSDLLDLARVDEGGDTIADAPVVDLDDVVLDEVARVHGPTVDASAVSAGRVRGRRNQLDRAVRNLLENAEHHAASRVDVALTADDGAVVLVVDDDGPGIPEADRERVFDRFTRLDEGRDRDAGGAGLGLAMVKAIVEHHGGTVAVDEGPLGGARFVVRLPAGETVPRDDGAT